MKLRIWHVAVLTTGILFAVSTESVAQSVRETRLRANPYRDGGGSCVYDRDGKLVSTPAGKTCRDRTNHLGRSADGAPSALVEKIPPALREQLRKLLSDHEHISTELAQLRQTIQDGSRAEALERADKVGSEVEDHRGREEEFIEELADHRATH